MMRNKAISAMAVGASLLFGHAVAQAAEDVNRAYIKALGTYIDADDDRNVDNGVVGGVLGFGYSLSEHFNLEFDLESFNLDGDGVDPDTGSNYPDQDQTALNLNVLNIYNRSGLFAPYLLGGVGVVSTDISGAPDDSDLQLQGGAGVLTRLWGQRLSLRTEALYRWQDAPDNSLGDLLVNVGFSLALGSDPVPAAAPPPPPPPPPPPLPPAKPLDSDGDGVIDANDRCPNTPKGDRVGPQGCTCDVTRQIEFAFDSAKLTDKGRAQLEEMAGRLNELQFIGGTVIGHTDSIGTEAYNQKLSERRAQTVADFLESKGIAPGRLQVSGRGESEPIASNDTAEGRAQNRRVTLSRTDCEAPK
jgi:OmpA-OmpF porin, OOP family